MQNITGHLQKPMSSFNLLDYLEKLNVIYRGSSWIECICPVCNQKNFKINAKTGAYKCYSSNCSSQDIRNSVAEFSPYTLVNPYRVENFYSIKYTTPIPIAFSSTVSLGNFTKTNVNKTIEENGYTFFYYNKKVRTIRFQTKEGKRIVSPQYLKNNKWVSGIGEISDWNLFGLPYNNYSDYIFAAEGEKCCTELIKRGYSCITPPSFAWTEDWCTIQLSKLKKKIKGVLYFSDNDKVGFKKSKIFSEAVWRNHLECEVVILEDLLNESLQKGVDIADLLQVYNLDFLLNLYDRRRVEFTGTTNH